jgi:hypothetical protein
VLLAQKCPELISLSIGEDEGCRPSGSGITDSIIDEAAQKTKTSQLILIFDRPDLLTWQSILSLARHCKNLEILKLSCNFTSQEAISGAWEKCFPRTVRP